MKHYIVDIETDGFLEKLTKIHCMVIKDIDSGEVKVFRGSAPDHEFEEGLEYLHSCSESGKIIGHNLIKFDLPAIQKLYPSFSVNQENVIDTLVLSRLIHSDMRNSDSIYTTTGRLPNKLWGSHGLKAWGYRLGILKGDLGEAEERFDVFTPEMLEYCKQDVEVTEALYAYLTKDEYSQQSIDLEHKVTSICGQMERNGWVFDEKKAAQLYGELAVEKQAIVKEMQETFEPITVDRGFSEKTGKKLKDKVVEFNPGSRQHIAQRLQEKYGWVPTEHTPSGQVKIDEEVLGTLPYPEAKTLANYFLVNKRLGQLADGDQAWLKLVRNGKIHGTINTNGAVTGRCTHQNPNMAQVPSVSSKYGKECRELFTVSDQSRLVGCDLSGLELRCLAHFMARWDDGAYGRIVIEGKQEEGTDIHTVNQKAAGLPTRANAKTFIYGYLYGAGDAKIGTIIGKGAVEGKKLKAQFLKSLPALHKLKTAVTERAKRGYLIGLDGRHVHIRSEHAALNTLLQSAGAIVAKQWLVEFDESARQQGYTSGRGKDFALVGWCHDELQVEVRKGLEKQIGELLVNAAVKAGEAFNFKVPIGAEYSIGDNWYDTH